jgi:hypothetical protein
MKNDKQNKILFVVFVLLKVKSFVGSNLISGDKLYLHKKKIIEKGLLEKVFPSELVEYFEMTNYQELCSVQDKLEYIVS